MRIIILLWFVLALSVITERALAQPAPKLSTHDTISLQTDSLKFRNIAPLDSNSKPYPARQPVIIVAAITLVSLLVYLLYNVRSQ